MNEEIIKKYHEIYTAGWKFFRKYNNPDRSDKFWEQLVKEAEELNRRYDSEFLRGIMNAIVAEIDRIDKKSEEAITYRDEEMERRYPK